PGVIGLDRPRRQDHAASPVEAERPHVHLGRRSGGDEAEPEVRAGPDSGLIRTAAPPPGSSPSLRGRSPRAGPRRSRRFTTRSSLASESDRGFLIVLAGPERGDVLPEVTAQLAPVGLAIGLVILGDPLIGPGEEDIGLQEARLLEPEEVDEAGVGLLDPAGLD